MGCITTAMGIAIRVASSRVDLAGRRDVEMWRGRTAQRGRRYDGNDGNDLIDGKEGKDGNNDGNEVETREAVQRARALASAGALTGSG
eukprot:1697610-Rhodomonas_salina.3